MFTRRGVLVAASGVGLWLLAVVLGAPSVHVIAVGVLLLPLLTALLGRRRRGGVTVTRHLSDVRVEPGRRITVHLDVSNTSGIAAPLILLEDRLPTALAPPARLVLPGTPARATRRVSYELTPPARGRFRLGPITVDLSDPFALTRRRVELDVADELVVTPEVEDLTGRSTVAVGHGAGGSRSRSLLRTGQDFYTMRPYQTGDDLRRIHWPSTARTGELMIRQDESSRRGHALLYLDTRQSAVGRSHGPGFERAVACAASIGTLLLRGGFQLRLATTSTSPRATGGDALLDALSSVSDDTTRSATSALARLRAVAAANVTLVAVTAPPGPGELPALLRAGAGFGPKLAVLVYPTEPSALPPDRSDQLAERASQAYASLARSGWDAVVLTPSMRLQDVWKTTTTRRDSAALSP